MNQKHYRGDYLGGYKAMVVMATRLRLATPQQVLDVAELSGGTFWRKGVDMIVTLAA